MKQIMTVLVGSQAHGLARPNSDFDYRGVFVVPTEEVLGIEGYEKFTNKKDDTQWELGHFCRQALKCNPSILETLVAPADFLSPEGEELRALFPKFLSRKYVRDAFCGFAASQKKAVLSREVPLERINKFFSHYLRMLHCGEHLLRTGQLIVDVRGSHFEKVCRDAKEGLLEVAEGLEMGRLLEMKVDQAAENTSIPDMPDRDAINDFVVRVRLSYLNANPTPSISITHWCH